MANIHFKKHLIHTCVVQRNTPTQSATGELIPDWADVDTIDCRFIAKTERIASESAGFPMAQTYKLLVNTGEDVDVDDIIRNIRWKSSDTLVDEGTFRIEAVLNRNSTKAHHTSLSLEKVNVGGTVV